MAVDDRSFGNDDNDEDSGYSPDFQDAYDRTIGDVVSKLPVFDEWVKKFESFINAGTTKEQTENQGLKYLTPSRSQIRALGYNAKKEGIDNLYVEAKVKDKRTATGYRIVYRDIKTGYFAKNPYKENKE